MRNLTNTVEKLNAESWIPTNTHLVVTHGSRMYNCHTEDSDYDYYGIVMPPKALLFPYTSGLVFGFDEFPTWEQTQLQNDGYDFNLYSITKFFRLAYGNNPNILEVLYAPQHCINHVTQVGRHILNNRDLFLSQQVLPKLRGYAHSQKSKLQRIPVGKRRESFDKHGYDVKFASHLIRLALQAEFVLNNNYLSPAYGCGYMREIRAGEYSLAQVLTLFNNIMIRIEGVPSSLPVKPDKGRIRNLLVECLEMHYGNLDSVVNIRELDDHEQTVTDIVKLLQEKGYC